MAFIFIVGLAVGSFLNVVGLRFLSDEPITHPPSKCPHCQAPIRPADNIPVLSFILLGGACRQCKAPISIQYPLIELATGCLFAFTVWSFGLSWQSLFLLFLISNLIVIFITDLRESYIFTINSLSLVPAGLAYNLLNLGHTPGTWPLALGDFLIHVPNGLVSAVIAVIGAIVFFEGLILLSTVFFGTEGFGHGDTHLMMGVGAYLGWPLTLLALLLGFVAQAVLAVPMLVVQWIRNKQWISLGSGAAALVFGCMPLVLMDAGLSLSMRTAATLLSMLLAVGALIVMLKQVKTSQSFTYLPLGPALVIGTLVALFWGPDLVSGYTAYLHHAGR